MNTLDRYLYRTVLLYTLMTMTVLLALGALILFISQQGDIGTGSYSAGDAFLFTLLNLPQTAFELLPIGALIGALMGLGNLAAGSELKCPFYESFVVGAISHSETAADQDGVQRVDFLPPLAGVSLPGVQMRLSGSRAAGAAAAIAGCES